MVVLCLRLRCLMITMNINEWKCRGWMGKTSVRGQVLVEIWQFVYRWMLQAYCIRMCFFWWSPIEADLHYCITVESCPQRQCKQKVRLRKVFFSFSYVFLPRKKKKTKHQSFQRILMLTRSPIQV